MTRKKPISTTDNLTFHIPDLQIPFHDPRAISLVNQVIAELTPTRIRQKGDMIDCYKISRFDTDPDHTMKVEEECDIAYDYFDEWADLSPGCELEWEEGNHEFRWEKLRREKGLSRRSIRDIPELMQQDKPKLGVKWIKTEDQPTTCGRWLSEHGSLVRSHSAYTARAMLDRRWDNVIVAHTHRIGTHARTKQNGQVVTAHECGCLCRMDPEYITGQPNWQLGFAIQYHYKTHDELQVIPIYSLGKKYYCTVHGVLYSG